MLRNKGEKALQVINGKPIRGLLFECSPRKFSTNIQPWRGPRNCARACLQQSIIPEALTRQYLAHLMGSVLRLSVRREKARRRNAPWPVLQGSSSKERREFLQRRAAASLVVFEPHARGNVIAAYGDLGAAGGGRQCGGDDHLTGESRVRGFEFDRPHDSLVGDQSHKATAERVG